MDLRVIIPVYQQKCLGFAYQTGASSGVCGESVASATGISEITRWVAVPKKSCGVLNPICNNDSSLILMISILFVFLFRLMSNQITHIRREIAL